MASRVLRKSTFHVLNLILKQIHDFPILKPYNFSTISNAQVPIFSVVSQRSHNNQFNSLADIFQKHGFLQPQLHDFLQKNQFLIDFNSQVIEQSMRILLSFKFSQNSLVSMICNCPGVLELGFLKKWELGFSQMGISNVSSSMIRSVLEHSRRFGIEPSEFSKIVRILKDLGFSDNTVIRVLEEFPGVVMMDQHELHHRIEFLLGFFRENEIDQVYNSCPLILSFSIEHRLKPLLEEFMKLGFNKNVIRREILRDPIILTMELGELSRCLEFLNTLKCRVRIKEKIYSHGLFRAGFEVKLRIDCLCKHGLIRTEAFSIIWREPRTITYSVIDIEKKIDFLLHKTSYGIEWLVKVPEFLGVHLEKQIIPRYNVIEYLGSKGGLGDKVGLDDLIKPSSLKFYNLYVKPYPECQKIFGKFTEDFVEVKKRHPVGLWKMFKPQSYEESEKDVENMKSFMEGLG